MQFPSPQQPARSNASTVSGGRHGLGDVVVFAGVGAAMAACFSFGVIGLVLGAMGHPIVML